MQIYHHNKIQFNNYDAVFEQNLYIFMTGTLASNNAIEKQFILKNKSYTYSNKCPIRCPKLLKHISHFIAVDALRERNQYNLCVKIFRCNPLYNR